MSKISIDLHTEADTGDISINIKAECNLNELEVATGALMGSLATQSTTGYATLKALMLDIENAGRDHDRTENTEKNN